MEKWKVELTRGGRTLAEVKIQIGIFNEVSFLPLLFVMAMMLLNDISRKCIKIYKVTGKHKPPYVHK